jgi:hypothetical protein
MAELTVPLLNFSPLGDLGKSIKDALDSRAAGQTLSNIYNGPATVAQPSMSLASLGQPQQPSQANPSYANAIGSVESSNNYQALGPQTSSGDRAYGRYQVMGQNIPQWTKEVLGTTLTPQQFLANPQAQDAVFNAKFGQSVQKYGNPQDAASVWFSGRPVAQAGNASDGSTTVPQYVQKFNTALNQQRSDALPANSTPTQGQSPLASQQGQQPITRDQFQALAANPQTRPLAMAILQSRMAGNQFQFMNVNGKIVATNPKTGQVQDVTPQGMQSGSRSMTAEEKKQYGLSEDQPAQIDASGKVSLLNEQQEKNNGLMNVGAGGTVFDPKTRQPVFRNTTDATLTDDATNTMADQYLAGDKSVLQNLGRGAQGAANLVKLRNTIQDRANARGMDGNAIAQSMISYVGDTARERTAATQEGRMVPAGIEASGAIELGRAASAQVPRTRWVPVNKALQAYERGTSDPKLRAFGAANTTIINTYARAINPNGVGTVADKEHAREMLSTADGPDAYNAVLDQMQKEIELAHTSPSQARAGFAQQRAARLSGSSSSPAQVSSQQQYMALPSGTQYVAPDGSIRVKQ